jgi:outer membrane protein assembly factor BamD
MNKRSIFLISSVLFLSSCSFIGGAKDTKKLVADGLTPKELYEQAKDKEDSGILDQAIDQYEIILSSYPSSKYAIQARLDIAYSLFKKKKYNRAIIELDKFIKRYPNLPSSPYAYYLKGIVAEEKSSSLLDKLITDSAQRDVESVADAYQYFVELIENFPNSVYTENAKERLVKLRNTLARHEFYVAVYYTEIGSHIAAINRSKFIIENYPNSASIPDGLHLMAYNYDKINADELAIDARKVLSSSYPNYSPGYSVKK